MNDPTTAQHVHTARCWWHPMEARWLCTPTATTGASTAEPVSVRAITTSSLAKASSSLAEMLAFAEAEGPLHNDVQTVEFVAAGRDLHRGGQLISWLRPVSIE